MRTAPAFWRRSPVSASTSTLVFHRPDEINWVQIALKMALGLILFSNFLAPFAARGQNLGTSPQFGQAVQGQQATTVEGTVLNIVNWSCNIHRSSHRGRLPGYRRIEHFKSGRGYLGWGVTGVSLMVISGLGRMAEGSSRKRKAFNSLTAAAMQTPQFLLDLLQIAARSRSAGGLLHAGCRGQ